VIAAPHITTASLDRLVVAWREEASVLEKRGDDRGARLMTSLAADLEAELARRAEETLNLREAALECGYSEDHLGRLIRGDKLLNVGRKNAPRVRRSDLPVKKAARVAAPARPRDNLDGFLQDIITSKFGDR
jgi:hypothetical protein